MKLLVRDNFEEFTEEEFTYSYPNDEDEAFQLAVERLVFDMKTVMRAEDSDDLITRIADMKEIIDIIDMMSKRQVSVRQVNLRKKYGSYTDTVVAQKRAK